MIGLVEDEKKIEDRKVIRIAVTETADEAVNDVALAEDMTKVGVASRIYEWMARQAPGTLKRLALGQVEPEQMAETLRAIAAYFEHQAKLATHEYQGGQAQVNQPGRRKGRNGSGAGGSGKQFSAPAL